MINISEFLPTEISNSLRDSGAAVDEMDINIPNVNKCSTWAERSHNLYDALLRTSFERRGFLHHVQIKDAKLDEFFKHFTPSDTWSSGEPGQRIVTVAFTQLTVAISVLFKFSANDVDQPGFSSGNKDDADRLLTSAVVRRSFQTRRVATAIEIGSETRRLRR